MTIMQDTLVEDFVRSQFYYVHALSGTRKPHKHARILFNCVICTISIKYVKRHLRIELRMPRSANSLNFFLSVLELLK